jgi:hypothetical protein
MAAEQSMAGAAAAAAADTAAGECVADAELWATSELRSTESAVRAAFSRR